VLLRSVYGLYAVIAVLEQQSVCLAFFVFATALRVCQPVVAMFKTENEFFENIAYNWCTLRL